MGLSSETCHPSVSGKRGGFKQGRSSVGETSARAANFSSRSSCRDANIPSTTVFFFFFTFANLKRNQNVVSMTVLLAIEKSKNKYTDAVFFGLWSAP